MEKGARHLILLGRREPSHEALAAIAGLEEKGVRVRVVLADVADRARLEAVLADAEPPLGGIVHSAGALDDALFADQTWERFESVFRSKVYGTWNLHELTASADLDFFVIFSSIASLLGAAGQANHAAANAFEDSLAWARRSLGLPATCINWGAWKGSGSADRPEFEQRRQGMGLSAFDVNEGLDLLDRVLDCNPTQIGVARMNWARYAEGSVHRKALEPMLRSIEAPVSAAASSAPQRPGLLDELTAAPEGGRMRLLENHVRALAGKVLGVQPGVRIDGRQPLNELGLDSLMAVEFRNGLSAGLGRPLPATLLFSYPAIDDITRYLAEILFAPNVAEPVTARAAAPTPTSSGTLDAVEELSDEEVDRLLAAKLNG